MFNRTNKKIEKLKQYLTTTEGEIKYSKYLNREIIVNMITPQTAEEVDSLIRYWNEEDFKNILNNSARKTIKIFINAQGGDLNSALLLADTIKISKTPIDTINIGYCSDNAMLVYLAGHKRFAYPSATFSYKYINPIVEMGGGEEPESQKFSLSSVEEMRLTTIKNLFIERTKITENKFNKNINNGFWFTAKTATEQFICNEIVKTHSLIH